MTGDGDQHWVVVGGGVLGMTVAHRLRAAGYAVKMDYNTFQEHPSGAVHAVQLNPTNAFTVRGSLHDVEGYRHHEIGVLLGVSVGTSKSQLHRARMALRGHLTAEATS